MAPTLTLRMLRKLVLAGACWAVLGWGLGMTTQPGLGASDPEIIAQMGNTFTETQQRTVRIMLQGVSLQGVSQQQLPPFDPVPDIPVARMDWLKRPASGWPVWKPPPGNRAAAGGEDSVGLASVARLPTKSTEAAQRVVLQVMSHMSAADAAQDSCYNSTRDGAGSHKVPVQRARSLLPEVQTSRRSLINLDEAPANATSSEPTPEDVLLTAALSKPAPRRARKLVARPGVFKTFPNAFHRYPSLPAPFNNRLPPTGLVVPAAPLPKGCLLAGSVKRFGVKGDGASSDSKALLNANGSGATRSLYFPVGTYRVTGRVVLTKPVIMGAGTKFQLDPGAVLVLQQQPRRAPIWYDPMFVGKGVVQMGAGVREVYPAWWSDYRLSDDAMLQLAIRSCVQSCTVLQTRTLFFQNAVTLSPSAGHFSTANAGIVAAQRSTGKGFVVSGGAYKNPLVFTSIRSFKGVGISITGGVRNANIQVAHLSSNGVGLAFQGVAGRPIYNVTISHCGVMQSNQQGVVFDSPSSSVLYSGITVRINFVLTGGFTFPSQPSSGLLFRGAAPKLQGTQIIVQVVDPAQYLTKTQFAAVATSTSAPVSNLIFRAEAWNGGYVRPGTQVAGAFKRSRFHFRFSDTVGGNVFSFKPGSAYNWVSKMEAAAPSAFWQLVRAPGTLAQFVAANPRPPPQPLPMQFAGPSVHQSFYVTLSTDVAWAPGLQRTYYLHSYFSDPATNTAQMLCIAHQTANPGLYCLSVRPAPLPTERHRVEFKVVNLSRKILPAGSRFWFGVQIGPSFLT